MANWPCDWLSFIKLERSLLKIQTFYCTNVRWRSPLCMVQTKQTARKDTRGKPLAMGRGRGKANPKKNPTPGGRVDRKVVLEYSSDESPDENNPQPAEGAEAPKRMKKQIHLTLPTSPAHVTTTETFATFFINHGLTRALQKAFTKRGWSTNQMMAHKEPHKKGTVYPQLTESYQPSTSLVQRREPCWVTACWTGLRSRRGRYMRRGCRGDK